jgi:hypothetical protein
LILGAGGDILLGKDGQKPFESGAVVERRPSTGFRQDIAEVYKEKHK